MPEPKECGCKITFAGFVDGTLNSNPQFLLERCDLHAAAPAMYEALKLLSSSRGDVSGDVVAEIANEALRQAEGKS